MIPIFKEIQETEVKRQWSFISLHHSLTKDGLTVDTEAIRNYHVKVRGWSDIGYNYLIERVGDRLEIFKGRSLNVPGAHTQGIMNYQAIGICLVGNFDKDTPTYEQYWLLASLIRELQRKYPKITDSHIRGHWMYNDYKTCPGENFNFITLRKVIHGIRIKEKV